MSTRPSKVLRQLVLEHEGVSSAKMMQCIKEELGLDRIEYCQIVSQIAESCRKL